MRKSIIDYKFVYLLMMFSLLLVALGGMIFFNDYTGMVGTSVPAEGGVITAVLIDDRQPTSRWHGLFGLVFSEAGFSEEQSAVLEPGQISSEVFVFDCVDPNQEEQEFYASTNNSIDFGNITIGTIDMVDEFLNITSGNPADAPNRTFTTTINISLGTRSLDGVPGVYTYVNDLPDTGTFFTGVLNDSGRVVFVIRLFQTSTTSFKGTNVRYQALLPTPNATTKYFFFADPNDECPAGFGTGQIGDAAISGFVFITNTTTPIPNASVSAGGNTTLTDAAGFFNITVPGNRQYNLISIKEGFNLNYTLVNTTIGSETKQNLTMSKFYGFLGPNGTISGYVRDNTTNATLSGVEISIKGLKTLTNGSGNYSLNVSEGGHVIAAVLQGYENFVGNFSLQAFTNLTFNINMTPFEDPGDIEANGTVLNNGTIIGQVADNITGLPLANVSVSISGFTNLTDPNGTYNITAIEGLTNLVATKDGYNPFFHEVNISSLNITEFNFNMSPVQLPGDGVENGTLIGFVRTTTRTPIEDAEVSIVGQTNTTNSTGEYIIFNIPEGTHNIVSVRTGFENFIGTVNITAGNITQFNITMETVIQAGLGAGSGTGQGAGEGPGQGPGLGPGRGPGTGVQAQVQEPTEVVDWEVSIKQIIKKLAVGNFITVPITITSYKDQDLNLRFSIEGNVRDMVRMDQDRMLVEGRSSGELTLTLLGNQEPGIYEGFFVISGDINEKIPIYVLLVDRERLDVESLLIKVTPVKKRVSSGSLFKYRVDLQNLLSEDKYPVKLRYTVEGITTNRSLFLEEETIVIHTSFSLLKSFRIPNDMKKGDYALKVHAEFLELAAEQSTIFTIVEPFYMRKIFGKIPLWIILLIALALGSAISAYYYYKKKAMEKRRYGIEVDYGQLPKDGPRSAFVGKIAESAKRAFFDMEQFTVHTLIAGSTGSGKTVAAQDLVEEALLKGSAVIVFDPTAQWSGFLRRCEDKRLLKLYKDFSMKKSDARAFNGNVKQINDSKELIDIKKYMKPGEIHVFVTNKLDPKDMDTFVANTVVQVFHANLPEAKQLKLMILFDEVHRLLPKFGGSGKGFIQIERATREFRKWGVGLILISQVLSDFVGATKANINTEIQMRTRDQGDLERVKEKYGQKVLQSLVKSQVGTGIVQNSAYNKGKPFFVAFRPLMHSTQRLTDEELENYNKYNEMVDDLDYQLEQLEKEELDVFDLKLELKLALDKVKSGNFNMVKIYLEGLKPRIQAQWDKIGKKPQKRMIKMISDTELKEELEKAKAERKKFMKSQEAKPGPKQEAPKEAPKEQVTQENKEEKQENTQNNQQPPGGSDLGTQIENLVGDIKNSINQGDKAKAQGIYGKIQQLYKEAPKELKSKLLSKCVEAGNLISGA